MVKKTMVTWNEEGRRITEDEDEMRNYKYGHEIICIDVVKGERERKRERVCSEGEKERVRERETSRRG